MNKEPTPVTVPGEQREDKWIREMAAKEDGCFVNIGSPLEHVMLTRTRDHEGNLLLSEAQPLPAATEIRRTMDATIPFAELFERSKDDRAIIVGSEVREVIGAYRRCLSKLGDMEAELSRLTSENESLKADREKMVAAKRKNR